MQVIIYIIVGGLILGAIVLFLVAIKEIIHNTMSIEPAGPQKLDFTGIPLPAAKRRTMDVFDDEQGLQYPGINFFGRRHDSVAHAESDGMMP